MENSFHKENSWKVVCRPQLGAGGHPVDVQLSSGCIVSWTRKDCSSSWLSLNHTSTRLFQITGPIMPLIPYYTLINTIHNQYYNIVVYIILKHVWHTSIVFKSMLPLICRLETSITSAILFFFNTFWFRFKKVTSDVQNNPSIMWKSLLSTHNMKMDNRNCSPQLCCLVNNI